MLAPAPAVVEIVTDAGTVIVMLSDSSPLNVTAPADADVDATVASLPLMIVPNARGAVAAAEIGVTIVAELETLADCADAALLIAKKLTIAASVENVIFICVPFARFETDRCIDEAAPFCRMHYNARGSLWSHTLPALVELVMDPGRDRHSGTPEITWSRDPQDAETFVSELKTKERPDWIRRRSGIRCWTCRPGL